jgi:hypothetical protein
MKKLGVNSDEILAKAHKAVGLLPQVSGVQGQKEEEEQGYCKKPGCPHKVRTKKTKRSIPLCANRVAKCYLFLIYFLIRS